MAISKVDFAGQTLIDLTKDTVTAAKLLKGATAHDKAGNAISGTASAPKPEQEKEVTITENGDVTITPDVGKVLSKVLAHVNVPMGGGNCPPIPVLTDSIGIGDTSEDPITNFKFSFKMDKVRNRAVVIFYERAPWKVSTTATDIEIKDMGRHAEFSEVETKQALRALSIYNRSKSSESRSITINFVTETEVRLGGYAYVFAYAGAPRIGTVVQAVKGNIDYKKSIKNGATLFMAHSIIQCGQTISVYEPHRTVRTSSLYDYGPQSDTIVGPEFPGYSIAGCEVIIDADPNSVAPDARTLNAPLSQSERDSEALHTIEEGLQ